MRAIRQVFPNGEVPVPEVFGWRKHGDQVFIYMSIIHGKTLREVWPLLTEDDKRSIQSDLSGIIASLRRIAQDPPNVIGTAPTVVPGKYTNTAAASINGGTVQDRFF
jgi:hypothetical protein